MADQLATPEDLASALQLDYSALTPAQQATMVLLVECATAVVQEAAGQRIVQVVDDQLTIMGTSDSWLDLPQIPVTAVSAVTLDGSDVTDWKLIGNRLWRSCGWQMNLGQWWGAYPPRWFDGTRYEHRVPEPSVVTMTVTHGHAAGAQELQLGRSAVLSLAVPVFSNPGSAVSESIDDYSVSFASAQSAMAGAMDASPYLKAALRRQYGRRGGLVRIG